MPSPITREQWLNKAVRQLNKQLFIPQGVEAKMIKVSVGFPLGKRGKKNKAIGQCWSDASSEGGFFEIFISPVLVDPIEVLGVLTHEMVHAIVGTKAGHKAPFKHLATSVGLVGKMTETNSGEVLVKILEGISEVLGKYPHAKLTPVTRGSKGSRLIKIVCESCPNVARQALSTFDNYGLTCGSCDEPMITDL
jgi:hypothetical protein